VSCLDFIWIRFLIYQKFLDYGWTWTEFYKLRTGYGSQNMSVYSYLIHSSHCQSWCTNLSHAHAYQ